jgi:C4-dicarboxylate-specific signal transduction histidine kinase
MVTVIFSNVVYLGMMLARAEIDSIQFNRKNKKLMNALKKQTKIVRDLMRVQAFSVVGTYGSTVVHEVMQPLTAMRFALENLKIEIQKIKSNKLLNVRLRAVESSANRATAVIENLRNFIVEREVNIRSVELNKILQDVLEITQIRAQQLHVKTELVMQDKFFVQADEHQLEGVLFNIMNNALDAIERNFQLVEDRRLLINIKYIQQKTFVLIKVVDSGVGLQVKDPSVIFEWLSPNSNKGMGIGLALCKIMVESWRGNISAYNADPKVDGLSGAVFELKLRRGDA